MTCTDSGVPAAVNPAGGAAPAAAAELPPPPPVVVPRWHLLHRFSRWQRVWEPGGVARMFTESAVGFQDRQCVVCHLVQRRIINIPAARPVPR